LDDRASAIRNTELGQPLHEGTLKRGQTRHHGYDGIAERLRKPVRSSHRPGQEIRGPDDLLDHGTAFGAVALEQPLIATTAQDKIELPDQIPRVMPPGIHPLPPKGTVNVSVAEGVAPVLRGRGLEIVDDRGRVRASITILPADPSVKMPDGTTGYPETVLLRLISSEGRPNVKIAATERGAGQLLGGESDPTYVQMLAEGPSTSLKLSNQDGREHLIKP
jgi:hypothetical protein